MKKLMIGIAAVALAVSANAAVATWGATSIGKAPEGTINNYVAYLFDSAVTDYDTLIGNLKKGDVSGLSANIGTKNNTLASTATSWSILGAKSTDQTGPGWAQDMKPTLYAIILNDETPADATYFLATDEKQGASGVSSQGAYTVTFGSQSAATWQSIPEPTSGLLLLIGVAGLALRRRRA